MPTQRIYLTNLKLWWPAWQMGIPFRSFGYQGHRGISGEGYSFDVDTTMDSWLCEDGALMPIETAKLYRDNIDGARFPIKWTSFTIVDSKHVQVNYVLPHSDQYNVNYYKPEEIYFEGETYREDE